MFKKMLEKRAELKATLSEKKGLQKGFTLIEMLVVLLILAVLIAVLVMQFGFLSKVDGTELLAESKNVESAALQTALADGDREFPGVPAKDDNKKVERKADGTSNSAKLTATVISDFMTSKGGTKADADKLFKAVAESAGLTEAQLASLTQYVSKNVDKSVAGNAETTDYLIVVKKSQISADEADKLTNYADELAGTVFSALTVTDSDGKVYNGTNAITK